MAFLDLNGLQCYYRLDGKPDRPVLVLAHSLGLDHGMFDPQIADLASAFRVVRYDIRGHGASGAPSGDYTLDQLGTDALAMLDGLGVAQAAWCGVSLGGMIGQWLAVHAASRVSALVLSNTTPRLADPSSMEVRRATVLTKGMAAVADTAMGRFFGPALAAANPAAVAAARVVFLATSPTGYAGCCAALRDMDLRSSLDRIRTRTLVISGDADESMPWDNHGAVLAHGIPGARSVRLATAHLSNLGLPRAFTRAVMTFLNALHGGSSDPLQAGMTMRRSVLGDAHVDRAVAATTDLTRDFQSLITKFPWAEIWTRPGLDHRTRRLLVLATTASLGRWEEFRLHLSAGLDHGLEWSDVEEVLLQTAAYAGVPAGNTGFKIAAEERALRTGSSSA